MSIFLLRHLNSTNPSLSSAVSVTSDGRDHYAHLKRRDLCTTLLNTICDLFYISRSSSVRSRSWFQIFVLRLMEKIIKPALRDMTREQLSCTLYMFHILLHFEIRALDFYLGLEYI